jgi:hypothetical protein
VEGVVLVEKNKIDLNILNIIKSIMASQDIPEEKINRVDQLKKVQDESRELFSRKNADYGDAFATYGSVGILVRIGDKINRLTSITNKSITLVDDESLRDTLVDLHNYAAMAVMLLDEKEEANYEANKKNINMR